MRRAVTLLALAAFACLPSGEEAMQSPPMGEDKSPIYGVYETTEWDDASDLTTSSIAGTAVKLVGEGGICSGVLVARDTVLTAAHCEYAFTKVTATNAGKSAESSVKSYEVHRDYHDVINEPNFEAYDIAVLKLKTPIPSDVVKNVAPVFFGDIELALRTRQLRGPALIAGYGRNCAPGEQCSAGTRYKGYVTQVETEKGILWAEIDRATEAGINSGDSGGPMFMKDRKNVYHVVGIASSIEGAKAFWTVTGRGNLRRDHVTYPVDIGRWILPRIGTVHDGDGIDDDHDNCAPWHCIVSGLPLENCNNQEQEDEDGDGIGDACDNCPPWRCEPYDGRLDCRNRAQFDFDEDGIGDACDLCPGEPNQYRNEDRNGNLVGDHCEDCPGVTRPSCHPALRECEENNAGRCVFDFDRYMQIIPGRCERPLDFDGDGIPNACDLCPYTHKRLDVSVDEDGDGEFDDPNANANDDIESEYKDVVKMGDICEPVPQLDFQPVLAVNYSPRVHGLGYEGIDWIKLYGRALLADDGTLDPEKKSFTSEVAFRHCACYDPDTGLELTEEKCAQSNECRASWAVGPHGSHWKIIHPRREDRFATNQVMFDASYSVGEQQSEAGAYFWDWYKDTLENASPRIESRERPDGLVSTFGLVASVVSPSGASERDRGQNLRVVRRVVSTPYHAPKGVPFPDIRWECLWPNCHAGFLPNMRHIYEPWEWLHRDVTPYVIYNFGTALAIGNGFTTNESSRFAALLSRLQTGGFVLIPPLGDAYFPVGVPAAEDRVVGVLVPRKGMGLRNPARVRVVDGILRHEPLQPDNDGTSLAVLPDHGGRAIYSAREEAVYLLGVDQSTSEAFLRRFDFVDGSTTVLEGMPTLAQNEEAASVAFDLRRNRIYILFRPKNDPTGGRISSFDLETRRFVDLMAGPLRGSVSLGLGPSGELLVVSDGGTVVSAYAYDIVEDQPEFVGVWQREGWLLGEPHPSLPIVVGTERDASWVSRIHRSDFGPGQPLDGLYY